MNSDDLIRALAADLAPVRRLRRLEVRAAQWATFAVLCVSAGAVACGLRGDFSQKMRDASFWLESAALLAVAALAARSAFRASVPGADDGAATRWLPFVALVAWLALVLVRHASAHGGAVAWSGLGCVRTMVGLALVPSIALFLMLRRAAPLERGWTGFHAALAASAFGMCGTHAICANDGSAHVLAWHFVPVLLAGLAGVAGKGLLARRAAATPTAASAAWRESAR